MQTALGQRCKPEWRASVAPGIGSEGGQKGLDKPIIEVGPARENGDTNPSLDHCPRSGLPTSLDGDLPNIAAVYLQEREPAPIKIGMPLISDL